MKGLDSFEVLIGCDRYAFELILRDIDAMIGRPKPMS